MNVTQNVYSNNWHTDIIGLVRNTDLPLYKALMPLFEAIANSMHSVASENEDRRRIKIKIIRDLISEDLLEDKAIPQINGFEITDYGSGFNEENYISFRTVNSRRKEDFGGKGLGRFTWLKAYESVEVQSCFLSTDGSKKIRTFRFVMKDNPIEDEILKDSTLDNDIFTIVKLKDCFSKYKSKIPLKASTIAQKIIEHHIASLLQKDAPIIEIIDSGLEVKPIILNSILKDDLISSEDLLVDLNNGEELRVQVVKLNSADIDHTIALCAHEREVTSEKVSKFIPDLKNIKINDAGNDSYYIYCLVHGKYLDERVSSIRTALNFDRGNEEGDLFDESENSIYKKVALKIEESIKDFLSKIAEDKKNKIYDFINNKEPEYRVLLKHSANELRGIPAGLSDDRLDVELYKIRQKLELNLREGGKEIIKDMSRSVISDPKYQEKFHSYVTKIQDLRQSELTKYVLHRRTILDLLQTALQVKEGGYALEEEVHRILYPTRTTSDEIEFGQQNLWIIDERLAYHYHIASDIELRKNKVLLNESTDRPDILIFDRPAAFIEGEAPFHSVVIIELKRPERDDYSGEDDKTKNPLHQINTYIRKIRAGEAIDENGERVIVPKDTRFYCYLIADLTDRLRIIAEDSNMKSSIDELGFYGQNESLNSYTEIISFKKLLEDAKKRNKVLFNKLGLPNQLLR